MCEHVLLLKSMHNATAACLVQATCQKQMQRVWCRQLVKSKCSLSGAGDLSNANAACLVQATCQMQLQPIWCRLLVKCKPVQVVEPTWFLARHQQTFQTPSTMDMIVLVWSQMHTLHA